MVPSKNEFAQGVLAALKRAGQSNLSYDEQKFTIHVGDKEHYFLSEPYAKFCSLTPTEQRGYYDWLVRSSLAVRAQLGRDFRAALVPVIEEQETMLNAATINPPVLRPFADDLVVTLFYDQPDPEMLRFATKENLQNVNLTVEEGWNIAYTNLRRRTKTRLDRGPHGVYISDGGDAFGPSRLLLTDYHLGT